MIDKKIYDLDYIRELQARYKPDASVGPSDQAIYGY